MPELYSGIKHTMSRDYRAFGLNMESCALGPFGMYIISHVLGSPLTPVMVVVTQPASPFVSAPFAPAEFIPSAFRAAFQSFGFDENDTVSDSSFPDS